MYLVHSQREDNWLFVALALSDDKEGARENWYKSWNACTQLYTFSKHAQREQWVLHRVSSIHFQIKGDGVKKKKQQPMNSQKKTP